MKIIKKLQEVQDCADRYLNESGYTVVQAVQKGNSIYGTCTYIQFDIKDHGNGYMAQAVSVTFADSESEEVIEADFEFTERMDFKSMRNAALMMFFQLEESGDSSVIEEQ